MWNLDLPDFADALRWHVRISERRRGGAPARLAEVRPVVTERFAALSRAVGAGSIRPMRPLRARLTTLDRKALNRNYGPTATVRALKDHLRQRLPRERSRICPYCGFTPTDTWDHVLPKDESLFPEFAVHPANLVPACSACNRLRGTRWNETLHVLTDRIDEHAQFLFAIIEPWQGTLAARFRLRWSPEHGRRLRRQVRAHLRTLGLLNRWREHATLRLHEIQGRSASRRAGRSRTRRHSQALAPRPRPNPTESIQPKSLGSLPVRCLG